MYSEELNIIIRKFFIDTKVLKIDKISTGNINETYLVEHIYNSKKSKFILQSLSKIFSSHEIININHKLVSDHINNKLINNNLLISKENWKVPSLIKCKSNNLFIFPFASNSWRAMTYIDNTFSIDSIEDEKMAYQTGIGLAKFHLICSDLDSSKILNSSLNFHNTKYYIDKYLTTLCEFNFEGLDIELKKRLEILTRSLSDHVKYVEILFTSLRAKSIERNIIHGDTKLSNFLFDIKYKYVVSLIDLDTVSSGYLLTDLADCIRSICNLSGEEPKNKYNVSFDVDICESFLKGYFSITDQKNKFYFRLLPEFVYILIFELTIRFLTDFLASNRYFKVDYEAHNLFRAEIQFQLLCSFLSQIPNFSKVLDEIGIFSDATFFSDVQKFI